MIIGCDNRREGETFSEVKRLVAKWIGTRSGIWETQELFPKGLFTHMFVSPWNPNARKHWDSDLCWFRGGRICGVFPPLCVLAPRTQIFNFFDYTSTAFVRRIFPANSKSGMFGYRKVTRNPSIPLLHPNMIICTRIYVYTRMHIYTHTGRGSLGGDDAQPRQRWHDIEVWGVYRGKRVGRGGVGRGCWDANDTSKRLCVCVACACVWVACLCVYVRVRVLLFT